MASRDLDVDYSSVFLNVLPLPTVYRSSTMNINNVIPMKSPAMPPGSYTKTRQFTQVNPFIQDFWTPLT